MCIVYSINDNYCSYAIFKYMVKIHFIKIKLKYIIKLGWIFITIIIIIITIFLLQFIHELCWRNL
jgi:hypothetical protein